MVVFVLFVIWLGWFFGELAGLNSGGIPLAILIALIMTIVSYYKGDKIALNAAGAQPITEITQQRLYHTVENLCITDGLMMPKVYVINDPAINAFATGRDPLHASLAVTTGALEKLDNDELQGVISHEVSHIKNYDIRIMTIVVVLVGSVSLLVNAFMRIKIFGRTNEDRKDSYGLLVLIITLAALILSPIVAQLIKLSISRKREYLADASGALLTRYPEGLARALEKIAAENRPMLQASAATAHLFIANPFDAKQSLVSILFSTHPPIQDRIKILRKMIRP